MIKKKQDPKVLSDWARQQNRILLAVILQDMKTRFGGSYMSYLIAIAWPFTHVATIAFAYLIANNYAPIGDDPFVFITTAAVPYMLCLYPARFIAIAVIADRPFLSYNLIEPNHLILARIILEFLNVSIVVIFILMISIISGSNVMPLSTLDAAAALAASIFFGVSLGYFFAIMTSILGPFFNFFVIITMIVLYVGSFSYMPDYMISSGLRDYIVYNPVYGLIKWLRSAYYASYQLELPPREYVIFISFIFLFLGFSGERLFRGRIIGG